MRFQATAVSCLIVYALPYKCLLILIRTLLYNDAYLQAMTYNNISDFIHFLIISIWKEVVFRYE